MAVIDSDRPCRVALEYSAGRAPNPIWQRLPRWLTLRLGLGQRFRTVTTETIDWQSSSKEKPVLRGSIHFIAWMQ